MSFTLEELLPEDQRLRTVFLHDTVQHALNLMHQHRYNQLPVVDSDGRRSLDQVVTYEGILQAVQSFDAKPDLMHVRDVARSVRTYSSDADLLATLDDIQRENFALIVDHDQLLTGIVTTSDTTVFFREYAQDLMLIEGIEIGIKEAITALYEGDESGLETAIAAVTDRAADIRRKIPAAIKGYLEKAGANAVAADNNDALAEAERRLSLPKPGKTFDHLTLDEFATVMLRHPNAPRLAMSPDVTELRRLLQVVRDARNKLAHFRGELTAEERRSIHFAAEWLERNLPEPKITPPTPPPTVEPPKGLTEPERETDERVQGAYLALARHLNSMEQSVAQVSMTFQDIERILGKELPRSAYEYRAWWANDLQKPQSAAWLDEGWRATSVNTSGRRVTFVRSYERRPLYITFFGRLLDKVRAIDGFPTNQPVPSGANWQVLAFLRWRHGLQTASIFATFTRDRLRVELYLDSGNKQLNKERFDQLEKRKQEIESIVGEALNWERRDDNVACRVAIYTKANIRIDAENTQLVDWAVQKAASLYKAFAPEFPE